MVLSNAFLALNRKNMSPLLTKRVVAAVLALLVDNRNESVARSSDGRKILSARILERAILRFLRFKQLKETMAFVRRDSNAETIVRLASQFVSMKYLSKFNEAFKKGRWRKMWKHAFSREFDCLPARLCEITGMLSDI